MSEASAFGVVHKVRQGSKVQKSFKKIRLRMANARWYDDKTVPHKTMGEKMRGHALEFRHNAGSVGAGHLRRMPADKREKWASGTSGGNKYGSRKPMTNLEARRELKRASQGLYDAIGREGRKNKRLP